ncbi:MAG: FtsX-like permease family protein, partial [Spirochaetia bacterium]|nr:FtsX-like permease family protein [Spirochaetia bacterium]
ATEEELKQGKLSNFPNLVHYNKEYLQNFNRGKYIIIGREMARYYGWQVGDRLRFYVPQGGNLSRNMNIISEEFIIAGFFRTGYYEFDLNLIFLSLDTAQRILHMKGNVTEVIVQLKDLSNLEVIRDDIRDTLPGNPYQYYISTIKDEHGNFLAALQLEKTLMIMIMGLLILAGVAGIWVTVHLLVKSKNKSIGMLRSMGMPTRSIVIIFTAHSMLIGLLSTLAGGSYGIFISNRMESIIQLIEDMINGFCGWYFGMCSPVSLIPKDIYYFDHLPVYADLGMIYSVAFATMILSGLAGYFPSRKAAMMDPVETIRND